MGGRVWRSLPRLRVGGLPPNVDSVRQPSPEPSLFSVYHSDAVVINGMPSFSEVLADRRGRAVVLLEPVLQFSCGLYEVHIITLVTLNFVDHSGLVQLVQFVLWVDMSGPDGVCGPDVDLDALLSDVACKGVRGSRQFLRTKL